MMSHFPVITDTDILSVSGNADLSPWVSRSDMALSTKPAQSDFLPCR
jgi:hypothetical protein